MLEDRGNSKHANKEKRSKMHCGEKGNKISQAGLGRDLQDSEKGRKMMEK